MQKKFGARFFLPEKLRHWAEYNYYRSLAEADTEEGEHECCICLNPLSHLEGDNTNNPIPPHGYQRIVYMQTPCNHKFHTECLKPWLIHKLECPKCRTVLPPLDEEEF